MVQHPKTGQDHVKKTHGVPETTGTKDGSSSRNIQRKSDHLHGKEKKQGGGGVGGKGDWNPLSDGSM
eukprot:CAMPEP_0168163092 /NCGR_PEP_ID=MMETSP0139_2-20121125/182_1 /TAXON_ID=44445 /ORGANISM="Pseudo-nitzschia australis, Strain 10249 10 AB" /LENGTH=66 /DNA_ID=CAMNT_0008079945 /DNA_START=145 /DNA_END=345 /DNA_ORIENTATION=-